MEPELDIFDQCTEEREKKSWLIRKLKYIPSWWNNEGQYLYNETKTSIKNTFWKLRRNKKYIVIKNKKDLYDKIIFKNIENYD